MIPLLYGAGKSCKESIILNERGCERYEPMRNETCLDDVWIGAWSGVCQLAHSIFVGDMEGVVSVLKSL